MTTSALAIQVADQPCGNSRSRQFHRPVSIRLSKDERRQDCVASRIGRACDKVCCNGVTLSIWSRSSMFAATEIPEGEPVRAMIGGATHSRMESRIAQIFERNVLTSLEYSRRFEDPSVVLRMNLCAIDSRRSRSG